MSEITKEITNVIEHVEIDDDQWVKFRHSLMRKLNLNSNENQLYSYLYFRCKEYKPDGYWCGLSNENLAYETCLTIDVLKRALKTLKDKRLIVIENGGTGMRKIYINDYLYLNKRKVEEHEKKIDQLQNEHVQEIERLKAELERVTAIAKRVEELEAAALPNAYVQRFIEAKYIKKADIPQAVAQLNDLYKAFMMEFGVSELEYHIDYMLKELASKQVKNVISYLAKAVGERSKQLASKPKQEKMPKITQNSNKQDDWLDRMQVMNQERNDDPEETARLQKELADMMAEIQPFESTSKQPKEDEEQMNLFDFI